MLSILISISILLGRGGTWWHPKSVVNNACTWCCCDVDIHIDIDIYVDINTHDGSEVLSIMHACRCWHLICWCLYCYFLHCYWYLGWYWCTWWQWSVVNNACLPLLTAVTQARINDEHSLQHLSVRHWYPFPKTWFHVNIMLTTSWLVSVRHLYPFPNLISL